MKNKSYITVVTIENKLYLQLTDNAHIMAYDTKEEAIGKFDAFKNKAMSNNHESHISGSMGILNLKPHILEVPTDNPTLLAKYVINEKPFQLKGSFIGGFVNMIGVEVNKDILELSICNVSKDIIEEVYK